jgi:hypothetical protein
MDQKTNANRHSRRLLALLAGAAMAVVTLGASSPSRAALTPINLARAGTASQSSTLSGSVASRAIDGNLDGNWADGSVSHTNNDPHSWWEVNLGAVRSIGDIHIKNRTDCCADRILPFVILVSPNPIFDSDITASPPADGMTRIVIPATYPYLTDFTVPVNRQGQYVRIGLLNQNYLQLAEVEVFEAPNAAMGRTASQSSTSGAAVASRGVDNNVLGTQAGNSVAITNTNTNAFYQVDLQLPSNIREVDVWTGTDCCVQPVSARKQIKVWLSPTPFTADPTISPPPGAVSSIALNQGSPARALFGGTNARYVRVQVLGTESLSVAELQVTTLGHATVGATAKCSSIAPGFGYNAATLINNVTGDVVATQTQSDPYCELDLVGIRYIDSLRPWIGAGNGSSLGIVAVSTVPFTSTTVAGTKAQVGANRWWDARLGSFDNTVSIMQRARYVRVMINLNTSLALGEIELQSTEGLFDSPRNGQIFLSGTTSQTPVSGYTGTLSNGVDLYAWIPAASGNGGSYTYINSASPSQTPIVTNLANVPVYPFNFGTVTLPAGAFVDGGVAGLYAEEGTRLASAYRPIRGFEANASGEGHFWPDVRMVDASPSPDDNVTKPLYLDKPMGVTADPNYYTTLPAGMEIPTTLTAFNSQYSILAGAGAATASYYNRGDLGIGRKMTCARGSWTSNGVNYTGTVCKVANYTTTDANGVPTGFGDSLAAFNLMRNSPNSPFATVVMVWKDGSVAAPSFGVYDKNGNRSTQAKLDLVGHNIAVPNNCATCHGGSGDSVSGGVHKLVDAAFLPFDPAAFDFDASPFDYASQAEQFRKLNLIAQQTNTAQNSASPGTVNYGIDDFINGTYHNAVGTTGTPADLSFVTAGWSKTPTQAKIYKEVVAPFCRGCHISQKTSRGGYDFLSADTVDSLRALYLLDVCKTKIMPHSQQSMKQFWKTAARAQLLGYLGRHETDKVTELCGP